MGGPNYRRGYDAEKNLCAILSHSGQNVWVERFHASKGTFDIIASDRKSMWLCQVKRSKRRIVSLKAVTTAFREDLSRMQKVKTPPGVLKVLALYIDRQPGEVKGTWRFFVVEDQQIVEGPILGDCIHGTDAQENIHAGDPRWQNLAEDLTGGERS